MTAATAARNTRERSGETRAAPIAAAVKCYAGTIAARDANGRLTKGATATTLRGVGVFVADYDNTSGAAGAFNAEARVGIFAFANSASGDAITKADIGADCYIVDDQTVAKTHATNTRSIAGRVFDVDTDGVWVDFR